MNQLEFSSKTLLCYSVRKNVRIDLSCLPDDIFDIVLQGLADSKMCVMGSPFTGKYIKDDMKAVPFVEMLTDKIKPSYPRVCRLVSFLDSLSDGDVFRIVSEDAPTMNKQLAVLKIQGTAKGKDERAIHNDYLIRFGRLTTTFRHYAYGYDGIKNPVGEGFKPNRVCRFCGKKMPEVSFKDVAHAVSEGLGNKILLCNEECTSCNHNLSKLESNLIRYLAVRRAMGGILSKSDGNVPSVDGKGFVIRGDENNKGVLYIEKESLPVVLDTSKPFWWKLETTESVTHQGIYKALCKIVIDLIPSSELKHFHETIGWINGSVMDNELPPYYASYDREQVLQPTVDIFLSGSPGTEPYCMAVVHILDVLFAFVLPEVDVDKARFKTVQATKNSLSLLMDAFGGLWQIEDSSEYTLSNPWVYWHVNPDDPQICILPKSDPVFMRYKRDKPIKEEEEFPEFTPVGISLPVVTDVHFIRHSYGTVTMMDLQQVSINFLRFDCLLDKETSSATFFAAFNFSDSSNRLSFFDFSFTANVNIEKFDRYIRTGEYFCIDYHLRDFLCELIMSAADKELKKHTVGSDLEPVTMGKVVDRRTIRQLYYIIPVTANKYMKVKDAEVHN